MKAKVRRILHFAVAAAAHYSGLIWLWRSLRRALFHDRPVCVLGLHRVLDPEERRRSDSLEGIVLSEDSFVRLLEWLRCHFTLAPLSSLPATAENAAGKPVCVLTFDDGWHDNYCRAFPWLRKFQVPAAIFLATGLVGSDRTFWVEELLAAGKKETRRKQIEAQLSELLPGSLTSGWRQVVETLKHMPARQRETILSAVLHPEERKLDHGRMDGMLTWDQAREMAQQGIEFGAHTVTHPLLTYEDDATVDREVRASREDVQRELGVAVCAFAYPNGDWDERVRQQVEHAGYALAFTTQKGWYRTGGDRLTVPRILLHEGNVTGWNGRFSPAMLNFTLTGWW